MTIEEYFAVVGSGYSEKDAAIIGPALERLATEGHSSVDDIVSSARRKSSPLYPYFEWDDAAAAESFRKTQAGHLARSIKVVVTDAAGVRREMRAFYPVRTDPTAAREEQRQYVSIQTVLADRDLATQVWQDGLRRLQLWRAQFRDYDDVFGRVIRAIEETERELEGMAA